MTTFELADYPYSTDYALLADLAQRHSIICVLDYQDCRDVAQTQFFSQEGLICWSVRARGTCYISAFDEATFIAKCQKQNLMFLPPPSK